MKKEFSEKTASQGFSAGAYGGCALALFFIFLLCLCLGSVRIPLSETFTILGKVFTGKTADALAQTHGVILLSVRIPRVLGAALIGAGLSLCGAAMQGLLRNPLADGSTLGVSSGASLGAALAIAFSITFPSLPFAGTTVMAVLFSFGSLALILFLSWRIDHSLSTNTLILLGVVYSMFVTAVLSLIITFAGEKMKSIVFWTMGSLSGTTYLNDLMLLAGLVVCGAVLLSLTRELNAFSIGEENAHDLGVPVKKIKWTVVTAVSCLIGICVSVGGSIGFVGLVTPHMMRLLFGPNYRKLMPASLFAGAGFLMLCDLAARTLFSPRELPIGVMTSIIGAVVFVIIFSRSRKGASG